MKDAAISVKDIIILLIKREMVGIVRNVLMLVMVVITGNVYVRL